MTPPRAGGGSQRALVAAQTAASLIEHDEALARVFAQATQLVEQDVGDAGELAQQDAALGGRGVTGIEVAELIQGGQLGVSLRIEGIQVRWLTAQQTIERAAPEAHEPLEVDLVGAAHAWRPPGSFEVTSVAGEAAPGRGPEAGTVTRPTCLPAVGSFGRLVSA